MKKELKNTSVKTPPKNTMEILIAFRVSDELNRCIKATSHYCNMDVSTFIRTIVEANIIKPGQPFPTLPIAP